MTAAEGGGIFVSYRREETSHLAGRLYDRLADRFGEGQVFIDVDAIEPGVDFAEEIFRVVAACQVLLAIIGPTWLTAADERGGPRLDDPDDIVRLEIEAALARGVRVIPILVEGAVMPGRQDLPESLADLARRNALVIRHESFRSDAGRLVTAIEHVLGVAPGTVTVLRAQGARGARAEQPYLQERINALRAVRAELNKFEEALRNSAFNRIARIDEVMEERLMSPAAKALDQRVRSPEDEQSLQLQESLRLGELARGIRLMSRRNSAFLSARENELVEIFIAQALEIHEKVSENAAIEEWWAMTLAEPLNASVVANAAREMINASAELDKELVALIKQQRA
jgi:hypothetical protein